MKTNQTIALGLSLLLATTSFAQNKLGDVHIDKQKKEVTVDVNKKGDMQIGASDLTRKPEAAKTESDKRQEQTEKGGQVFVRHTY